MVVDGLLMSLYATLAYREMGEFELSDARRIKVIPSHTFQLRSLDGRSQPGDLRASYRRSRLFESSEGEPIESEVLLTRLLAILILRVRDADVVAIRGTVDFHDVVSDLNVRLFAVEAGVAAVRFHEGFYLAAAEASSELNALLRRRRAPRVYMAGHSLGGAIAAIYHAHARFLPDVRVHECFTYGMPRYGNQRAVQSRPIPHHFHFQRDVDRVPGFPPKPSFADVLPNYQILVGGSRRGRRCEHAGAPVSRALPGRIARWARTSGHFVEHHVAALQCLAQQCATHHDLAWFVQQ